MKRLRFFCFFVTMVLLLSLAVPSAWAASPNPDVDKLCAYVLLEDLDSDTVLYSRSSNKKIYPASTTKLVTALVVLRHVAAGDISLDNTVTCTEHVQDGMTSLAARSGLAKGEKITIRSLLYLLMLPSHCDAGNALAEAVSGSVSAFADDMNATAAELGCTNTHFTNPHGLHNDNHYTTCADMYLLAKAAYEYEDYRTIISTTDYSVPATNKHDARNIHNTNALRSKHTYGNTYYYEYCTGGKTGSTFQAKYCLVSYAEKDGRRLCCVMMHGDWYYNPDGSRLWMQFVESKRLYEWGFEAFSEQTLVEGGKTIAEMKVENSRDETPLPIIAATSIGALLPNDLSDEDFTITNDLPDTLQAPIEQGQKLGTLYVMQGDEILGSTDLIAAASVNSMPKILGKLGGLTHEPRGNFPFVAAICLSFGTVIVLFFALRPRKRR